MRPGLDEPARNDISALPQNYARSALALADACEGHSSFRPSQRKDAVSHALEVTNFASEKNSDRSTPVGRTPSPLPVTPRSGDRYQTGVAELPTLRPDQVLTLQRLAGNQAVGALLSKQGDRAATGNLPSHGLARRLDQPPQSFGNASPASVPAPTTGPLGATDSPQGATDSPVPAGLPDEPFTVEAVELDMDG